MTKATTLLTSLAATAVLGCALVTDAQAQTVLRFSHTDQQQGARHAGALLFAQKVAEYTNNRYKVNVFCCGQLGNDPKEMADKTARAFDFFANEIHVGA